MASLASLRAFFTENGVPIIRLVQARLFVAIVLVRWRGAPFRTWANAVAAPSQSPDASKAIPVSIWAPTHRIHAAWRESKHGADCLWSDDRFARLRWSGRRAPTPRGPMLRLSSHTAFEASWESGDFHSH